MGGISSVGAGGLISLRWFPPCASGQLRQNPINFKNQRLYFPPRICLCKQLAGISVKEKPPIQVVLSLLWSEKAIPGGPVKVVTIHKKYGDSFSFRIYLNKQVRRHILKKTFVWVVLFVSCSVGSRGINFAIARFSLAARWITTKYKT